MDVQLDTVRQGLFRSFQPSIDLVFGKAEGKGKNWHGHLSAISVTPQYRRLGIAKELMGRLEMTSEAGKMNFIDLFVRVSNTQAIEMYQGLGYTVYRRVLEYYSDPDEDAFDMRKALSADRDKSSVIPKTQPVHWQNLEKW